MTTIEKIAGGDCLRQNQYNPDINGIKGKEIIYVSWTTGGLTGGGYWGNSQFSPLEGDPEPEFDELDSFLNDHFPDITFIQYKKLIKTLCKRVTWREPEYYGNVTDKAAKIIVKDDLMKYLQELKNPKEGLT